MAWTRVELVKRKNLDEKGMKAFAYSPPGDAKPIIRGIALETFDYGRRINDILGNTYIIIWFASPDIARQMLIRMKAVPCQVDISVSENFYFCYNLYFDNPFPNADNSLVLAKNFIHDKKADYRAFLFTLNILDDQFPLEKTITDDIKQRLDIPNSKLYREELDELFQKKKDEKSDSKSESTTYAKAIDIAVKANNNGCVNALWNLANRLKEMKEFFYAMKAFDLIPPENPYYIEAQNECGDLLHNERHFKNEKLQDLDESDSDYEKILTFFYNAKNHARVAMIFHELKQETGPIPPGLETLDVAPKTLMNLARAHREQVRKHRIETAELQAEIVKLKPATTDNKMEPAKEAASTSDIPKVPINLRFTTQLAAGNQGSVTGTDHVLPAINKFT